MNFSKRFYNLWKSYRFDWNTRVLLFAEKFQILNKPILKKPRLCTYKGLYLKISLDDEWNICKVPFVYKGKSISISCRYIWRKEVGWIEGTLIKFLSPKSYRLRLLERRETPTMFFILFFRATLKVQYAHLTPKIETSFKVFSSSHCLGSSQHSCHR